MGVAILGLSRLPLLSWLLECEQVGLFSAIPGNPVPTADCSAQASLRTLGTASPLYLISVKYKQP